MTSDSAESRCPGCGLVMPAGSSIPYDGYFNASNECWSLFTEVIGREFSNAVLFGHHPDKSIDIHLAGLYLMIERGVPPSAVAPYMQKLAERVREWPHFDPPAGVWRQTIFDVAMADDHVVAVREWSAGVWEAWSAQRDGVVSLLNALL
jgi:hypothetical protein